jgi:L-asparaginase
MPSEPVLLIHGGATDRAAFADLAAVSTSLDRIVLETAHALDRGATALETVTLAVEQLEDDPLYNAGLGSKLQADGRCRLSASIMDGHAGRFGGVINVQDLRHPIRLALHLLRSEDRVLDGPAAKALAGELRLPVESPVTERRVREWKQAAASEPYGTVGAVALDRAGRLAAATSTGGRGHERPGRVSDSATVAGNYADRGLAVSCTGIGEHIVEAAAAARLAAWVQADLSVEDAAAKMMHEMTQTDRRFGFIAVDANGCFVARHSTQCMTHRAWRGGIREGWPSSENAARNRPDVSS